MPLPKPCSRCEKTFQPLTKHSKMCNDCKKPSGWGSRNDCLTKHLNFDLYKEQSVMYKAAVTQMIRAFVRSCPRDVLMDVLKSQKLVKVDWSGRGTTYVERKPGEKL